MATTQDLTIDQGTNVKINYTVKRLTDPDLPYNVTTNPYIPINLTDNTISMMARSSYDSAVSLLTATTDNNKFTITSAINGTFALNLVPADTSNIIVRGESIDLVYDIELKDAANVVTRAFQGTLTVNREVTR